MVKRLLILVQLEVALTGPLIVFSEFLLFFLRLLRIALFLSARFKFFIILFFVFGFQTDGQRKVKQRLNKMAHLHQLLASSTELSTVI